MADYPTSLDNFTNPLSTDPLDAPSHSGQHSDVNDAVEELEDKLGVGASLPAEGKTLLGIAGGATSWVDAKHLLGAHFWKPTIASERVVVPVPYDCEAKGWQVITGDDGDSELDVWLVDAVDLDTASSADSVVGSNPPSTTASRLGSGDVTGWSDVTFTAGQLLIFSVVSVSAVGRWVTVLVNVVREG